jgi:hypothetical protein
MVSDCSLIIVPFLPSSKEDAASSSVFFVSCRLAVNFIRLTDFHFQVNLCILKQHHLSKAVV